eukprot:403357709
MLKLQGDYQNSLPIAYDLIKKSTGFGKKYKQQGYGYLYDCMLNLNIEHYKQISIKNCIFQQYYKHSFQKAYSKQIDQTILEEKWKEFEKFKEGQRFQLIFKNLDALCGFDFKDNSDQYPRLLDNQIKFILFKYFTHFSSQTKLISMDEHEQKILLSILKGGMFDKNYRFKFENYIHANNSANARKKCLAILSVLNTDENEDYSKLKVDTNRDHFNTDLDFQDQKDTYWTTHIRQAIYQAASKRKQDLIQQGIIIAEEELDIAMTWRYYIISKMQ